MSDDTVRVAVRIRPLVESEIEKGCKMCLNVVPGEPQIIIQNTDKSFTFNHVFPPNVGQEEFYNVAVKNMVSNIFHGYNVTILAYGQTGSGKTHSMGTDYNNVDDMGVIPRAIQDMFDMINSTEDWTYEVTVSFMELYQEQLYDLLSDKQRNQSIVHIREDNKGIKIAGITERKVLNAMDALQCLTTGSTGRATGATAMNAQSSRSHAIFTLTVKQHKTDDPNTATMAKFHLVDLAGSERSKKTGATGERFKEGVNINKGLLALGNVISQLGEGGNLSYIGYRDSNLTRLLQDSLGGNSMTLMIACVSPADYNLDETLSTLRYADRARKIKNKPVINQDPKLAEINRLNKLIQDMRLALMSPKIEMACPKEHQELEEKNQVLQKKVRDLTEKLNSSLIEIVVMHERAELAEQTREKIRSNMTIILTDCKQLLDNLNENPENYEEHRNALELIYSKILDIEREQKKTSQELINYEVNLSQKTNSTNNEEEEEEAQHINGDAKNDDSFESFDEKHEEYTLRQAERNHEVQNINRELAIKEGLVCQLLSSLQLKDHTNELREMEQEVKTLQAEKEELQQALQHYNANNVSSKLAESRRKKLQDLEKKIAELSKKCLEQNRVIKMKEKQDQQIKNLSSEIHSLKQTRVKLIRQMRSESDRFTKWKQLKEKELNKLRHQDGKRVNEIMQLKLKHHKLQNVLKRKMEEVFQVNKRLKEALDVQKKAAQRREKLSDAKNSIQNWLTQELEVLLSTIDAEYSLQKLMQDRASIVCQLQELNKNAAANKEQINELNEFLDLRNAQISDLQQRILESDQENRANIRLNTINTMADAKIALKFLFETIAEDRKKQCAKDVSYEELMEKNELLRAQLDDYKSREKERRYSRIQTERLNFETGESTAEDINKLKEELEYYKSKCDGFSKPVLGEINPNTSKNKKRSNTKKAEDSFDENQVVDICLDDSIMEDDLDKDPDWRYTPLYQRIQKLTNTTRNLDTERAASKRSSDGDRKCACKTKCATRICSCRKNDISCNNCGCNPEICQNRDKENISRKLFTVQLNNTVSLDSTKRARYTSEYAENTNEQL